jgi:hypothetical protein
MISIIYLLTPDVVLKVATDGGKLTARPASFAGAYADPAGRRRRRRPDAATKLLIMLDIFHGMALAKGCPAMRPS